MNDVQRTKMKQLVEDPHISSCIDEWMSLANCTEPRIAFEVAYFYQWTFDKDALKGSPMEVASKLGEIAVLYDVVCLLLEDPSFNNASPGNSSSDGGSVIQSQEVHQGSNATMSPPTSSELNEAIDKGVANESTPLAGSPIATLPLVGATGQENKAPESKSNVTKGKGKGKVIEDTVNTSTSKNRSVASGQDLGDSGLKYPVLSSSSRQDPNVVETVYQTIEQKSIRTSEASTTTTPSPPNVERTKRTLKRKLGSVKTYDQSSSERNNASTEGRASGSLRDSGNDMSPERPPSSSPLTLPQSNSPARPEPRGLAVPPMHSLAPPPRIRRSVRLVEKEEKGAK
ncbi:hypothetical protein D9757_003803 [Collybiopsis confluens]|uniref:Uncharacterized protein n=1 Tax=Collybiopsis confluens TaxID=2823264 RepID=A0A8H5HVU6_9AGAR|nr:hypothetical protein D9757_003803 [Collybiopsis confluens]